MKVALAVVDQVDRLADRYSGLRQLSWVADL